jgi:dipeptidyl aminopeptidase/acylaminoacyl peptidase
MLVSLLCSLLALSAAPPGDPKRVMRTEDYKGWETIVARDITDDGHWLWYQIAVTDGDGNVTIKNNDDPRTYRVKAANTAEFSDDSKWCAYLVSPLKAEADKLREAKKPIFTKLGLRNLENGSEQVFESVLSYNFLKGSRALLAQRFPAEGRPGAASDLLVITPSNGSVLPISGVTAAMPNHAGTEVALSIKTDAGEQGVELLDVPSLQVRPLEWGKDDVSSLSWSKNGNALAFLLGHKDESKEGDSNRVVEVTGLPGTPALKTLDPGGASWLPSGTRISESGHLMLSDDGSAVAFGIGDWLSKPKPEENVAHPEVWNTKDLRTVPEQRVSANADRSRVDLTVWWPGTDKVEKIMNGWLERGGLLKDFKTAVLSTEAPYRSPANNGWFYHDVYLVDTQTGTKKKVLEKTHWGADPSIEGHYLAYYKAKNWWVYDVASGKSVNATLSAHRNFEDVEDDHTVPEKPPAGGPIWLAGDKGVIFADFYDCWLYEPGTGRLTRLTNGDKDHVEFRFLPNVVPDPDENGPELSNTLFFSSLDRDTKASGLYACDSHGKGKQLIEDNARIGGLKKAKDADRVVFTMGSFVKSPNLYITNPAFTAMKPETKTNNQQSEFFWPTDELVTYNSRWGLPLQGVLIYPADYVKGRKYPMVTYIYERLSDALNSYMVPNEANAYSPQVFSQNGYFVFMPDIAYRGNNPGQCAVDCLEPAVKAVLDKGVGVDPDRVGLIGHSWGAYQTAFVTTVSSVFKVGCAGAPLTDLVSMYNTHYWNVGTPNAPILETSQGRLRVPFWEDPKAYIDNSPVWQSLKRKAPILITVGDQDGAVDFHQGIALYNTLRRMGKDCVLLVYYGENHNFTKRPDQLDYAHRLRHFLDVYLKGAKPEPWVSQGVPFIKKGE